MSENTQMPISSVLGELERERKAIDEAIATYRELQEKLASLPPHLAQKVVGALGQPSTQQPEPQTAAGSLVGKTSAECARQILTEHGNVPMHFADIAKEALARGYVGQAPEGELGQTAKEFRAAQSFWAMMHRADDTFEKLTNGHFKIRAATLDSSGSAETSTAPTSPSLTMLIADVLRKEHKPMRGADITKRLEKAGVKSSSNRGLMAMVFSALRKRRDLFKKVNRGVYRLCSPDDKATPNESRQDSNPTSGQRPDTPKPSFFSESELLSKAGDDLTGLKVVEAAIKILREHPTRAMHYKEIADIARKRGYSSGRSENVQTVRNSFREMLRRDSLRPDSLIRRVGGGTFRMRDEGRRAALDGF